MRYLVTARVKPGESDALARAIDEGTLGRGSIAGDEYFRNMASAREMDDGRVQWVEVCYCSTPLAEEREYWEQYFTLDKVQDAHARSRCATSPARSRGRAATATVPRASKRASKPRAVRSVPLNGR